MRRRTAADCRTAAPSDSAARTREAPPAVCQPRVRGTWRPDCFLHCGLGKVHGGLGAAALREAGAT